MNSDLIKIIMYATKLHEGQMYGNNPYVYHLDDVYKTYEYLFGIPTDSTTKIIYMHDSMEDCGVTEEDLLSNGLSEYEVKCVSLLTKTVNNRHEYLSSLSKDIVAIKVKIADSTSNYIHSLKSGNLRLIEKYHDNLKILWDMYTNYQEK